MATPLPPFPSLRPPAPPSATSAPGAQRMRLRVRLLRLLVPLRDAPVIPVAWRATARAAVPETI